MTPKPRVHRIHFLSHTGLSKLPNCPPAVGPGGMEPDWGTAWKLSGGEGSAVAGFALTPFHGTGCRLLLACFLISLRPLQVGRVEGQNRANVTNQEMPSSNQVTPAAPCLTQLALSFLLGDHFVL